MFIKHLKLLIMGTNNHYTENSDRYLLLMHEPIMQLIGHILLH